MPASLLCFASGWRTLGLAVALPASLAVFSPATFAANVVVVTDSRHPVKTMGGERLIELDEPARVEAELSAQLPTDPEQVEEFKQYVEAKGLTFLPISAATRQGVDNLPALVYNRLKDLPPVKVYEAEYKRPDKNAQPTRPFTVERTGDHEFTVDAPWLERILAGTNVEDYESLQYFQTQLGDSGILDELVAQGVEEEDTIKIGEYEFDYLY